MIADEIVIAIVAWSLVGLATWVYRVKTNPTLLRYDLGLSLVMLPVCGLMGPIGPILIWFNNRKR